MVNLTAPSSFGAWLKQARKALDMTQAELAASVGCSLKTIAKIESGERRPSKQLATLLASALGIAPDDFPAFFLLARGTGGNTGPLTSVPPATEPSAARETASGHTPHNLPASLTQFIGRDQILPLLSSMLRRPHSRLVTLTGVGGVGKTRLAVEVAREMLEDFQDGAYFVDLSSVDDARLFFSSIVRVLGLEEARGKPPLQLLQEHLGNKTLLLVLDNFEQLLEAAPLVAELLAACSGVKVLVTSREALRIRGEREIEVPPLGLPEDNSAMSPEILLGYEAIRLFVERAQDRQLDFTFTGKNASTIADICRKLDGLPLAIELAASRIKEIAPEKMLEQIDNRLQFVTGPLMDLPLRQRTLRSTIAWSYNLLTNDDKQLFRCLAVFAGSFTPQAICKVCRGDADLPDGMLVQLERLVDKSLLKYAQGGQEDEPRFSMLETIREYAREELVSSGDAETYHRLHANYFLALAEQAEPELQSARQKYWFRRLEEEHDNFREALNWSLREDEAELSLLLCGWLTMFWYYRGYTAEGREWLARALARVDRVSTELGAKLYNAAGILAWAQGDFNEAIRSYENSLAVWRELGDRRRVATTLYNIAGVLLVNTRFERARPLLEELVPVFREANNKSMLSATLNRLSMVLEHQGDLEVAEALCRQCLELDTETGDGRHVAMVKSRFGDLALRRGQLDEASSLYRESLKVFISLEDKEGIAKTLEKLGLVEQARGQSAGMAYLFGASSAIRDSVASVSTPLDHAINEPYMAAALRELGETRWQRVWTDGRAVSMERAIEYALGAS